MPKIDLGLDEIPFEAPFRLEFNGSPLVLIRTNNTVRAFVDRCPHAHWPLSDGELKNGVIQCIGHGWQFDVQTGRCLTVPVCSLKPLSVLVHQDRVCIEWE